MFLWVMVLGGLGVLGCLIGAFWTWRRKRLIDDLPTSKTQGVFIGMAELKGTAESEHPLTSYLAGVPCVQNDWQVDEHWQRIVVETYTDKSGTHTRTRTESGWTKVADGHQSIPFYLKDDTGIIRIVPGGATINAVTTFNQTCSPADPLYFGKCAAREIANSTHQRRFHETSLPLHVQLYIMGHSQERHDIVAAEIARDKSAPMFLISTRTEKQVSSGYGWWTFCWVMMGLLVALGAALASAVLNVSAVGPRLVLAAAGFALALALGWLWMVYNSLIGLHHRVEQGWSQVEVQLKRRHDLIPNLVSTVSGYRNHEAETQTLVTEMRSQMEATPPGVAGPDFKGLSPLLRVVGEQYPDLQANRSFLSLQQSLVDTEQRIALARDYFNDIATFYNNRMDIIPDRFVARMARLHAQTLMGAADFERACVEVQLAS